MACTSGNCSNPNTCNCAGASYTIPSNAVYGDSTCRAPSEPCSEVTCAECVRNCHNEDKWCVEMPLNQALTGTVTVVEVCIHKGERLDQMLQKLSLAHGNPLNYPYVVKNFYINSVTSDQIQLIWYEYHQEVSNIQLFVAGGESTSASDWQEIPSFAAANPLANNIFNLGITGVLLPGQSYKLKLVTTANGITYDPGSAILYVTIP